MHKKCIVCLKKLLIFLQTCKETKDIGALQKGADFVRAFTLGFDVDVSHISSIVLKLKITRFFFFFKVWSS